MWRRRACGLRSRWETAAISSVGPHGTRGGRRGSLPGRPGRLRGLRAGWLRASAVSGGENGPDDLVGHPLGRGEPESRQEQGPGARADQVDKEGQGPGRARETRRTRRWRFVWREPGLGGGGELAGVAADCL